MSPTLNRVKHALKVWAGKAIILLVGLFPVSCHYHLTAPVLWAHQTSYAFEAWLLLWIGGILLAGFVLYICIAE